MAKKFVSRFHEDRDGAGMVEYAVLAALAVALGLVLMRVVGGDDGLLATFMKDVFEKLSGFFAG